MQANAVSHTASESHIRKQHTCMHAEIALCAGRASRPQCRYQCVGTLETKSCCAHTGFNDSDLYEENGVFPTNSSQLFQRRALLSRAHIIMHVCVGNFP